MASADPIALQAFLRASAAAGRTTLVVGPFTVHLHPHDPLRYLNYAIPAVGARPGQGDIAELRAAFRAHDRLPRLEWVEEAAPRMAGALRAAGMEEELRTPLMACLAGALADVRADVDELVVSAVGADDVRAAANLQRMAFGRPPLPADVPASDPRQGGGAVLARRRPAGRRGDVDGGDRRMQ
jgi:hypothetical protein